MRKLIFTLSILLLAVIHSGIKAQVLNTDSLALVDIYNAGDGDNWSSSDNWLTGPVSTWQFVTVTGNRVTKLQLNQMNMGGNSGTLSPSIGNLTGLTLLEIQNAPNLKGAIPAELWNCTLINRLQIKYTGMTGQLPDGIESMTSLGEINFQQTYLGGTIPAKLFELPALQKAYLHQSNFTGAVPSTVAGATGLTRLYLHENKLEGPLPFVNLPKANKAKVELTGNFFSFADVKQYHDSLANYTLTNDYQYAKAKESVVVGKGETKVLHGKVDGAAAYAWFRNRETMPLGMNDSLEVAIGALIQEGSYVCKSQSTEIPNFEIRTVYDVALNVSGLERDSLALVDIYNAADGANWTNAEYWLTDSVSKWKGITVENGRVTKLRLNQINMGGNGGTLSPSIGQLTELTLLEILNADNLKGPIPAEIWNCNKVTRLQIKFTGLTGGIPEGVESMTALDEINFQQTYLGGEIPEEVFNLPVLKKAYLHQSNFTGKVPASVANATRLTRLYLHENQLEGPLPFVNLPKANKAKVELTANYFTFDDVKQYHDSSANYTLTNDYQYAKAKQNVFVEKGSETILKGKLDGAESYAWFKEGNNTPLATIDSIKLTVAKFEDEGTFTCKSQTSLVPGFEIRTVYDVALDITGLERDSLALVDIYNAADGANWTNAEYWLTDSVSKWKGITVEKGRVTKLRLNQINMGGNGGTLSPSIGQLTELTLLEILNADNLKGSIPSEIWNCNKVTRLQIKFTGLTGGIPEGVESMTALGEINFQQTYLGGEIPVEVFNLPALSKAYLHQSNFTGKVPASVANATGLTRLYLHENQLEGPLPFVNLPKANKAKVELTANYFTFDDVKQYHDSAANYTLTNDYQLAQEVKSLGTVNEGASLTMTLKVTDGQSYAWFKEGIAAPMSTDTLLVIDPIAVSDTGTYVCKVQNASVANMDIRAYFVIDSVVALQKPVLVNASTTEDGAQLQLGFDMEMADPTKESGNFTIKVNGTDVAASTVSLDGSNASIVVLTLATAVPDNQATVTVSYTPGTLKGTNGGMVVAFTDQAATNNLPTHINLPENHFSIFPNPAQSIINVYGKQNITNIALYNITGAKVLDNHVGHLQNVSVSIDRLEKGVYFLKVTSENAYFIQKVVKK
jgi:uncharacterized repeat protein (TIGR02059 family)